MTDWKSIFDKAPEVPGDTCPALDRMSTRFDAVAFDLSRIRGEMVGFDGSHLEWHDATQEWSDEMKEATDALDDMRAEIEALRKANEQLRASGRYWYGVVKRLAGK